MSAMRGRLFIRTSACRDCGARLTWARNERGKWIPLELDPFAARDVPPRDRLLIRQGIAVCPDVVGAYEPVAVLHFRVCPALVGAARLPMLDELWPVLAHRVRRHQTIRG